MDMDMVVVHIQIYYMYPTLSLSRESLIYLQISHTLPPLSLPRLVLNTQPATIFTYPPLGSLTRSRQPLVEGQVTTFFLHFCDMTTLGT